MSTRKTFLTGAAALPLLAAVPAPTPTPAQPTPKPTAKPPSQAARALAERMRAFDAHLSEKNLDDIARGIDGNLDVGAAVNPKGMALHNWDEPATPFEVPQ